MRGYSYTSSKKYRAGIPARRVCGAFCRKAQWCQERIAMLHWPFISEAKNTSVVKRYCQCHLEPLRIGMGDDRDSAFKPRGLLPRPLSSIESVSKVTAISNPARVRDRRRSFCITRCVSGIVFRVFFIAPPCRFPRGTIDMGSVTERPGLLTLRERLRLLSRY